MKALRFGFTPREVQLILQGKKTMFRRAVMPQPKIDVNLRYRYDGIWRRRDDGDGCHYIEILDYTKDPIYTEDYRKIGKSPFDPAGRKIIVQETHAIRNDQHISNRLVFIPGEGTVIYLADYINVFADPKHGVHSIGWRHHWQMKDEWSRLTLEVTNVFCERVQDIGVPHAWAEGCRCVPEFRDAWDVSYDCDALKWANNPFVYAVSFKVFDDKSSQIAQNPIVVTGTT